MASLMKACTEKCHSSHHVNLCISALTKCSDEQFKSLAKLCTNTLSSASSDGRTVLHIAASMGRSDLIKWMVDEGTKLPTTDSESNWNALHRALFYGRLTTARLLISLDQTCLVSQDNEGRTPLDLVVADRPYQPLPSPRNELYSWGENVNFTLGQPSEQARLSAEIVGMEDVAGVKDVVLCKYHTLVLTSHGQVLSCGHGWGGRLGHSNEATVLRPKQISALKNESVMMVAAARDHSVFLTENNAVFTCGLNDHHQLGQEGGKLLHPKIIKGKPFKDHSLRGVCAGRFHTVVWASDALFTFGLNAGQLGHLQNETYQITPRLVSGIQYKTMTLEKVVSSDAAILCYTRQGEMILISEFKFRKIAANWTIEKVLISGGKLDHKSNLEALKEMGGTEVSIGVMNTSRQIFLWRQSDHSLRRVNYSGYPWLSPRDFQMCRNCLLIASVDGQVFTAKLPADRRKYGYRKKKDVVKDSLVSDFRAITLGDLCRGDESCYVELERVRGVHRAVSVFMDGKGQNFMAIQALPNENLTLVPEVSPSEMSSHIRQLYAETRSDDVIHDVILGSKNLLLPAHQFILSSCCEYFQSLFRDDNAGELLHVDVSELGNSDLIVQIVKFIYTGSCDLLCPGHKFKFSLQPVESTPSDTSHKSKIGRKTKGKSAYSVYQNKESVIENSETFSDTNPVKMLKQMAKSLGVTGLVDKLEKVIWQNGKVCLKYKSEKIRDQIYTFNRREMSHLFDIKLKSEDGQIYSCHKCILTARLEYFHSMLTSGWLETELSTCVTLPVIGSIFHVILQYIYTDDSSDLRASTDVEFICNVLVAADQLLVTRLKEICEVCICQHLSLKNAAEVLEFASVYNAQQLKMACQQFICLNLTALLEAHSLDIVSDETMNELSEFYRSWIPGMSRRHITPYDEPPSLEDLESLTLAPVEVEESKSDSSLTRPKSRRRRSSKSLSERRDSFNDVSVEMTSPDPSPDASFADMVIEIRSADLPPEVERNSSYMKIVAPQWAKAPCTTPTSPRAPISPCAWPVTSCGDVLGLRGIMEDESHQSRDQTADRSSSGGRMKKLSQKERKRLAHEAQLVKTEPESSAPSPCSRTPPISPPCPWAATSTTPTPSFRDLMFNEEQSVAQLHNVQPKVKMKTTPKDGKTGNHISWGLPLPQRGRGDGKQESPTSPPATAASQPTNPWTPLAKDKNTSFNEIIEEEMSEKVTLDKTIKKPLHLIQIEEQAIGELMAFYAKNNPPDVKISVERMTKTAAKPTWVAKQ